MNDNEKNLSLKLSQYEMLDKTLRDIIEKNRDTSAIDDILRGIKETIEDITSIRETMENEKLDAIPRRKRTKRTSNESVKYVQQDLFSLDASEFGIDDKIVKEVWEQSNAKEMAMRVYDVCVNYGGGLISLQSILEASCADNGMSGNIRLKTFDIEGNLLYCKTYIGCRVAAVSPENPFIKPDEEEIHNKNRILFVSFKYDSVEYYYGDEEDTEEEIVEWHD